MINMPRVDKSAASSHRNSVSTASAAGGGTRSSSWSTRDDETLKQARQQGLNWNQIAPKHFPSKSPNACRKRHERLMERQNAEDWDGVKLDILAQAYMEVRREMWSILAERVGEKWTLVEQKCMEKGWKNLNQAYRSAQKKQGIDAHDDSGYGLSDLDEEPSERHPEIPDAHEPAFASYATGFPGQHAPQHQQQRIPSIQHMLQPSFPVQAAHVHQHALQ